MVQVVPAILEKTWVEVQKRVQQIKAYTKIVQLDVMDGEFVPNITFSDPARLGELPIQVEVHLMIARPDLVIRQWAQPNITRIIVHQEATGNLPHVIETIKEVGKSAAVAINPATSTYTLREFLPQLDMVLIMGVEPGFSGQDFRRDVLEKIKEIKYMRPDILVEVDGGVNNYNRDEIVDAGADILVAASYIWNAPNLEQAIATLRG